MKRSDARQKVVISALVLSLAIWGEIPAEGAGPHHGRKRSLPCPPDSSIIELPIITPGPESSITPDPAAPPSTAPLEAAPTPAPSQTADAINDALAGQYDVASTSNFSSPNLLGDQFSGGVGQVTGVIQMPGSLAGATGVGRFSPTQIGFIPNSVNVNNPTFTLISSSVDVVSIPFGQIPVAFSQAVPNPNGGNIVVDPQAVGLINGFIGTIVQTPQGQSLFLEAERQLDPNGLQGIVSATAVLQENPDGSGSGTFQGPVGPESYLDYNVLYNTVVLRQIDFYVPNPSDGGVVGRTKLSDDNNPLPRDRFIFNYDYFNNVPLTANGWNVNRFSPGFEKTFFNQMTSIEFRFPFASTLNSTFDQAATSGNTEFGNIHATFKALFYSSPAVNVAAGMGVSIPTADDINVKLANGQDLVQVKNESVLLTPYVAALWTPNSRIFAQTWMQYTVDTNGNPVLLNSTGTGLASVGRLTSQTLLQLDGQIGYWLMRNAAATGFQVSGIAPFVELHYNTTLTDADSIVSDGVLIGDLAGRVDELNLSAGITMLFGSNLASNLGAVVPLRTGSDRFFDYQIGLHTSYYFGATARDRRASSRVSNF